MKKLSGECKKLVSNYFTDSLIIIISNYYQGKQILDRRYNEIKDVIESGHVDETKAVGK